MRNSMTLQAFYTGYLEKDPAATDMPGYHTTISSAGPIEGYLTRIAEYLRARPARSGMAVGAAGALAGGALLKKLFGNSAPTESD